MIKVKNLNIKNFIEKISYDERQKRKLQKYLLKKERYSEMDRDELEMNYIKILSKYEHKKLVLLTVMSTIFISILLNIWGYFFNMIKEVILYMYKMGGNTQSVETALVATIVLAMTFFCAVTIVIINFFHDMKKLTEEKIFIERLISKYNY